MSFSHYRFLLHSLIEYKSEKIMVSTLITIINLMLQLLSV